MIGSQALIADARLDASNTFVGVLDAPTLPKLDQAFRVLEGDLQEAMKREIHRRYPIQERKDLVSKLLERGVLASEPAASKQHGQCCDDGCAPDYAPKPIAFVPRRGAPGTD